MSDAPRRPPLPPFSKETALKKVKAAEAAWQGPLYAPRSRLAHLVAFDSKSVRVPKDCPSPAMLNQYAWHAGTHNATPGQDRLV
jgi:hypothetical protein